MRRPPLRRGLLLRATLLAALTAGVPPLAAAPLDLPRFTEEREAAALHFVKKHLPGFLPLLQELQKSDAPQYQLQVREIFRVTEMLADLKDRPRRHDLELQIWKTENRALLLVARLSSAPKEERSSLEAQLQELARDLVELEIRALEGHAEALERDLADTKEVLGRLREGLDKTVKDRYESLLERARKRKKNP